MCNGCMFPCGHQKKPRTGVDSRLMVTFFIPHRRDRLLFSPYIYIYPPISSSSRHMRRFISEHAAAHGHGHGSRQQGRPAGANGDGSDNEAGISFHLHPPPSDDETDGQQQTRHRRQQGPPSPYSSSNKNGNGVVVPKDQANNGKASSSSPRGVTFAPFAVKGSEKQLSTGQSPTTITLTIMMSTRRAFPSLKRE